MDLSYSTLKNIGHTRREPIDIFYLYIQNSFGIIFLELNIIKLYLEHILDRNVGYKSLDDAI